jgi:hypothetical protein
LSTSRATKACVIKTKIAISVKESLNKSILSRGTSKKKVSSLELPVIGYSSVILTNV